MDIREITKEQAYPLIYEFHYAKQMPRLTKHFVGAFIDDKLVGVITLGWGTQPRQTMNKMFPGMGTESYYEIGKMCMDEAMPRNSETQMMSGVVKWMKQHTNKLYLFTWSDGIVGKPGYVYQAGNFLYGGYIWTDIYLTKDGEKVHPRSAKDLLAENAVLHNKPKMCWLTPDYLKLKGMRRIKGKQFRYILPLTRWARRNLQNSTFEWTLNYPKDGDLEWKDATAGGKAITLTERPEMNLAVVSHNARNVNAFLHQDNALTHLLGV